MSVFEQRQLLRAGLVPGLVSHQDRLSLEGKKDGAGAECEVAHARLRMFHPGLEVHVEESNARELVNRVRLRELDLAVLFLPAATEDLTVVEIGHVELAVAVPPTTRWPTAANSGSPPSPTSC